MKHQLPDRVKFELHGDLIVVDKNGHASYTAKLFEPACGGGHSTKPLCRATGTTRTRAAVAVVKAAYLFFRNSEWFGEQTKHDRSMAGVWQSIED